MPYYEFSHSERGSDLRRFGGGQTPVKHFALVLGNEIKGLSPALLKHADKILEIPMAGKKESLNVAVTFGIIAFHLSRHLRRPKRKKA